MTNSAPNVGDHLFSFTSPVDSRFGKTLPSRIYKIVDVEEPHEGSEWNKEYERWEDKLQYNVKVIMLYQFNGLKWIPVKKSKEVTRRFCQENLVTNDVIKQHIDALREQIVLLETFKK